LLLFSILHSMLLWICYLFFILRNSQSNWPFGEVSLYNLQFVHFIFILGIDFFSSLIYYQCPNIKIFVKKNRYGPESMIWIFCGFSFLWLNYLSEISDRLAFLIDKQSKQNTQLLVKVSFCFCFFLSSYSLLPRRKNRLPN